MHNLLAQDNISPIDIGNSNFYPPAAVGNLGAMLNFIIPILSAGAALIFLGMLMLAGFTWITAGDKPENVQKAQKIMTFAVLGLLIVFFSYLAMKVISMVLGTGTLPF